MNNKILHNQINTHVVKRGDVDIHSGKKKNEDLNDDSKQKKRCFFSPHIHGTKEAKERK